MISSLISLYRALALRAKILGAKSKVNQQIFDFETRGPSTEITIPYYIPYLGPYRALSRALYGGFAFVFLRESEEFGPKIRRGTFRHKRHRIPGAGQTAACWSDPAPKLSGDGSDGARREGRWKSVLETRRSGRRTFIKATDVNPNSPQSRCSTRRFG